MENGRKVRRSATGGRNCLLRTRTQTATITSNPPQRTALGPMYRIIWYTHSLCTWYICTHDIIRCCVLYLFRPVVYVWPYVCDGKADELGSLTVTLKSGRAWTVTLKSGRAWTVTFSSAALLVRTTAFLCRFCRGARLTIFTVNSRGLQCTSAHWSMGTSPPRTMCDQWRFCIYRYGCCNSKGGSRFPLGKMLKFGQSRQNAIAKLATQSVDLAA